MKLIKERLQPLDIGKQLKELLQKHRSKQFVFNQKDFTTFRRKINLLNIKWSNLRTSYIYQCILATIISIIVIASFYLGLWLINYLMML